MQKENRGGNQRVTNAILALKIDTCVEKIDDLLNELEKYDDRIKSLEISRAAMEHDITVHDREIDNLRKVNNAWSFGNSIMAIVAGILASIGLNK